MLRREKRLSRRARRVTADGFVLLVLYTVTVAHSRVWGRCRGCGSRHCCLDDSA